MASPGWGVGPEPSRRCGSWSAICRPT